MSILFINGSPNQNGNTVALANRVLQGAGATVLNLTDYRINSYGQTLAGDQFDEVLNPMKRATSIIIGSPVYWHNICGSIRNLLDRFYGPVERGALSGKKLFFIYQGGAPEKWMLDAGEYTMQRFASIYGLAYIGMASNAKEADQLAAKLN